MKFNILIPNIDIDAKLSAESRLVLSHFSTELRDLVKPGGHILLPRTHRMNKNRKNGRYSLSFTHQKELQATSFNFKLVSRRDLDGALVIYGPDQLCWHLGIISQLTDLILWAGGQPLRSMNGGEFPIALVRLGKETEDELDHTIAVMINTLRGFLGVAGATVIFYTCELSEDGQTVEFKRSSGPGQHLSWIEPTVSNVEEVVRAFSEFHLFKKLARVPQRRGEAPGTTGGFFPSDSLSDKE